MSRYPIQISAPCVVLALAALPAPAVAASAPGAELASACTACHGTAGHSQGEVPALAGMDPDEFTEAMQGFKSADSSIMGRIAPAYGAADIEKMATYFAAQPKADDKAHE